MVVKLCAHRSHLPNVEQAVEEVVVHDRSSRNSHPSFFVLCHLPLDQILDEEALDLCHHAYEAALSPCRNREAEEEVILLFAPRALL